MDKVAMGQVFSPKYFGFPLSIQTQYDQNILLAAQMLSTGQWQGGHFWVTKVIKTN
jgi:hypothetical protein